MMPASNAIHVVWFKRDLRVHDHAPLAGAAEAGSVLPLLIVEPQWWREPDMSARQYAFFRESAAELADDIGRMGARLIVRVGAATDVLAEIARRTEIAGLWSHEETGNRWTYDRDLEVAAWCRAQGINWREFRQDGVIRRLASRNGWAGKWDKRMGAPVKPAPARITMADVALDSDRLPKAADLGLAADPCPERQTGGRQAGLATLQSFLNERGEPYRRAMSTPHEGAVACSRLSPHLAWGTVSMREITHATWRRQRELKEIGGAGVKQWRGSLISFSGRLHWHCHFMQKLEDEPRLEFENLHRAYDAIRTPAESDASRLAAWSNGETGLPFVDACMRCLAATGWMNFRMRAMLMATSSYHLWLHWREPGLKLARLFTDYEPGIHWPQTQMQSGTTGINTVRIYNPVKQGFDQDPDGAFIRKWLPELADLPTAAVHEPWKHEAAAARLDKTYPFPIVDHADAARAARQKIYGLRSGDTFRKTAVAIQDKHGSRKSGMPHTGAKTPAKRRAPRKSAATGGTAATGDQLALDFKAGSSS